MAEQLPEQLPQELPEQLSKPIVPEMTNPLTEPSCCEIFCKCYPPQLMSCQCCIGFFTCITCGGCLYCAAACCYGCKRPSCCAVCCAAIWFNLIVIWGWIAGMIVGIKMMCG